MITNELLQPDEEQQPQWSDLPPECRREVLLRLSDPRDIEASSEACEHLAVLAQEQRIWRELAQYHFTPQQIATTRQNNPGKDWKTIFTIARRLVELFCARIKSRENATNGDRMPGVFINTTVFCIALYYIVQIVRFAGGVRRNDSAVPQLSLLVLAIAGPSLHRGSGPGVSGEAGGC